MKTTYNLDEIGIVWIDLFKFIYQYISHEFISAYFRKLFGIAYKINL
jgi:hypothetical protein